MNQRGSSYSFEPVQPPPQTNLPSASPPARNRGRFKSWRSALSTLVILLMAPLIAIFIAAFVIQSYQVDGQSMETTLQHNDRLIINKLPRTWARITNHDYVPERGDIVIFNQSGSSSSGTKQLIKRVIGLPGERVVVKDGQITVFNSHNGDGFDPDRSGVYNISSITTPGEADQQLSRDEIFVVGDNRANSEDSRYFGPVKLDDVVGNLAFRIIPLSKAQRF